MTVNTSVYSLGITPSGSSPSVHVIPFPIESKDHIQVDISGTVINPALYDVTNEGLGGADSFTLTLNYASTTKHTVTRRTPKTQKVNLASGNLSEVGTIFDRTAICAQEGYFIGNEQIHAQSNAYAIMNVADPVDGTDAATMSYCNELTTGIGISNPLPAIQSVDDGKVLYSLTETTVGWRFPNDIDIPGSKYAFCDADADLVGVDAQTYPLPAYPAASSWLSQSSSAVTWRQVEEVPQTATPLNAGQTLLSDGDDAYWATPTAIPPGPDSDLDDIDTSVKFYLTIIDGKLSWKAYKYGAVSLIVNGGWASEYSLDSSGTGGGPQHTGDYYCVPDSGSYDINGTATAWEDQQPHLNRHESITIYHGFNQPAENLSAQAFLVGCFGGHWDAMCNLGCRITDKALEIEVSEWGLWFPGGGATETDLYIHYMVFGHSSDISATSGICRG